MFEEAGFPLDKADHALNTLIAFVIGMTSSEAALLTKLARSGQTERDWEERLLPAAEEAARAYPRLQKLYAMPRTTTTNDENFDSRVERVLAGIATWLDDSADHPKH